MLTGCGIDSGSATATGDRYNEAMTSQRSLCDYDSTSGYRPSKNAATTTTSAYEAPSSSEVRDGTQEWSNPLEKIEQLLTCSVCLDRYKHPKVLPCQHSFCLEPCLEGLADVVRRTIKCPECRVEHLIPLNGVKGFPTNYTLIGFLEIHLRATENSSAEIQEYIKGYNMEHCKVCDEKSKVEVCLHCNKKVCAECKSAHDDMMKRDLGRLVNQVRRAAGRIADSSESVGKASVSLQLQCETAKEEVKDWIRRLTKEIKSREETLLKDIEMYLTVEKRMMKSMTENLDQESNSVNESCEKVEKFLKGEVEMKDSEVFHYKQMFTEGLDYLRAFNPDLDAICNKKVQFLPGAKFETILQQINNFGDIQISSLHMKLNLQNSDIQMPRFLQINLESDHCFFERGNRLLKGVHVKSGFEDYQESKKLLAGKRNEHGSASSHENGGKAVKSSPWHKASHMSDVISDINSRSRQQEDGMVSSGNGAGGTSTESQRSPSVPPARSRISDTEDPEMNSRIAAIRRNFEQRQVKRTDSMHSERSVRTPVFSVQPSSSEGTVDGDAEASTGHSSDSCPIPVQVYAPTEQRKPGFKHAPELANDNERSSGTAWRGGGGGQEASSLKYRRRSLDRSLYARDSSAETVSRVAAQEPGEASNDCPRRHFTRSITSPDFYGTSSDNGRKYGLQTSDGYSGTRSRGLMKNRSGSYESLAAANQAAESVPNEIESSTPAGSGNDHHLDYRNRYSKRKNFRSHTTQLNYVPTGNSGGDSSGRASSKNDPGTSTGCSFAKPSINHYYTNAVTPRIDYLKKGRVVLKFGQKGSGHGQFNWPRGVAVYNRELIICDSSNHRLQVFDLKGQFLRTLGKYGNGQGEFDCLAGVCADSQGHYIVTDRYNHRVQVIDTNDNTVRTFGAHGQTNRRFSSPWGVTTDAQGFVYVCDKDNHRIQIFQLEGNFVGKFGEIGGREGQFQNPHFIACTKQNQLVVSDSNNHRIQVFDHNGHFIFAFGSEGFQEGQFKYPRGVAVDDQGFIIVADSGNNRIQIFFPDGRFLHSFGTWGNRDGELKGVEGVAITHDGLIVATDRENHRVQIF